MKWDNAKNICIRYNEEPARVRVRVREVDQIMIARAKVKELILGDIERLLELGDKAILTTESKQSLKVVMAVRERRSQIAVHEYIHFHAQAHAAQFVCKREDKEGLIDADEGVLSLLEFAYVPLKSEQKFRDELQNEEKIQ